ncbi:amidohydrolase family protein [Leifsonia sp. YIM 134122]|uniref:Amidohydrolase family protein n=1 Tax=Leifsonia stereocauli TaxID=3134136 RepID=A0ABU9W8E8_9MICO
MGFQSHTHATGDGGIRIALDAIEHAARTNGTRDRRHGIVHVECLDPDDLPRFATLGVTAAMQPRHCSPDLVGGAWMDNVGEQRWSLAWRFRSLADSGAHVALSSGWHVGEMDPLVGLYSALTRAGLDGRSSPPHRARRPHDRRRRDRPRRDRYCVPARGAPAGTHHCSAAVKRSLCEVNHAYAMRRGGGSDLAHMCYNWLTTERESKWISCIRGLTSSVGRPQGFSGS